MAIRAFTKALPPAIRCVKTTALPTVSSHALKTGCRQIHPTPVLKTSSERFRETADKTDLCNQRLQQSGANAHAIMSYMEKNQIPPNGETLNCLIERHSPCLFTAHDYFQRMRTQGIEPTVQSLRSLLNLCGQKNDFGAAALVCQEIQKRGGLIPKAAIEELKSFCLERMEKYEPSQAYVEKLKNCLSIFDRFLTVQAQTISDRIAGVRVTEQLPFKVLVHQEIISAAHAAAEEEMIPDFLNALLNQYVEEDSPQGYLKANLLADHMEDEMRIDYPSEKFAKLRVRGLWDHLS